MKEIPITKGYFAIVDDGDYERLRTYRWNAKIYVRIDGSKLVYANRSFGTRRERGGISMHREIMEPAHGMNVDHINGNGLDNRRENLRICSHRENCRNRHSVHGSSRYRGVSWYKAGGKWMSYIKLDGRRVFLGYFVSEVEAARTYDIAALRHFGEFASINTYD